MYGTNVVVAFPLPKLGDVFVRMNGTRPERCMITALEGDEDGDWKGVTLTTRGVEFIHGSPGLVTPADWHPEDWEWDATCPSPTFRPPGTKWSDEARAFIPEGANAASSLPPHGAVPAPLWHTREKYLSWTARVRQAHPALTSHRDAEEFLSQEWARFKKEKPVGAPEAVDLLGG